MSAWYLLWMLADVIGIVALIGTLPFAAVRATSGSRLARWRQLDWRWERRRMREVELYGEALGPCLYCGVECEFGPNCFNRHLAPKQATP